MSSPPLKTQVLLRRVASNSAPEQEFWKAIGSTAQEPRPNWGVDLNHGRAPLAADSCVYLVDTSTMWIAAAAIPPAQLASIRHEEGDGASAVNRSRAALAIAKASSRANFGDGAMSSPGTFHALASGLRAIATSSAFGAAAARSPMLDNHHWILLLYRLLDGDVIAGLGYVDDPHLGMLDRSTLMECVISMVEMDLVPEDSIVGATVRKHGGVMLAPELSYLRPSWRPLPA